MTDLNNDETISQSEAEQQSPFLSFLSSPESPYISHLILEYIAAEEEGGAQMILNLRKVCSVTSLWIDSLSPSQSKAIFFRIPIKLTLDEENLEKFEKCPPPSSASSIILTRTVELKKITDWDSNFPTFISFWRDRMQTLSIYSYTEDLLKVLGFASSLRNLHCNYINNDHTDTHPSLMQLEIISFHPFPELDSPKPKPSFFHQIALNRNLKQLSTTLSTCDNPSFKHNPLEGLQFLINAKRQCTNFQLQISFRDHQNLFASKFTSKTQIKSFISSVAASTSCIRTSFPTKGKGREAIERIIGIQIIAQEPAKAKKFFESIDTFNLEEDFSVTLVAEMMRQNMFRNLKTLHLVINDPEEANFLGELPENGLLQNLYIISTTFFSGNFPNSVTYLNLDLSRCLIWTIEEWIEFLDFVNGSCPYLGELEVKADVDIEILSEGVEIDEFYSLSLFEEPLFQNLRAFEFSGKVVGDKENGEYWDLTGAVRTLLFDIFQIRQMTSLLKCSISFDTFDDWDQNSECIECILNSPLSKSLVRLDLARWVHSEIAKDTLEELKSVVHENKKRREETYGRQGRRLSYFTQGCTLY